MLWTFNIMEDGEPHSAVTDGHLSLPLSQPDAQAMREAILRQASTMTDDDSISLVVEVITDGKPEHRYMRAIDDEGTLIFCDGGAEGAEPVTGFKFF